jgi:hypothetical protein
LDAKTSWSMRNIRSEYGRAARIRSCARRNFAADTMRMARVICCVFLTLWIRRFRSRRLGMPYAPLWAAVGWKIFANSSSAALNLAFVASSSFPLLRIASRTSGCCDFMKSSISRSYRLTSSTG